jgi:hypothetical protein
MLIAGLPHSRSSRCAGVPRCSAHLAVARAQSRFTFPHLKRAFPLYVKRGSDEGSAALAASLVLRRLAILVLRRLAILVLRRLAISTPSPEHGLPVGSLTCRTIIFQKILSFNGNVR